MCRSKAEFDVKDREKTQQQQKRGAKKEAASQITIQQMPAINQRQQDFGRQYVPKFHKPQQRLNWQQQFGQQQISPNVPIASKSTTATATIPDSTANQN